MTFGAALGATARTAGLLVAASLLAGCDVLDELDDEEAPADDSAMESQEALEGSGATWCIYPDWNSYNGAWCSNKVQQVVNFPFRINDQASMIGMTVGKAATRATLYVYYGANGKGHRIGSLSLTGGRSATAGLTWNDAASSAKVFIY